MTTKSNVTIYVNSELTILAREMGLNISKTCENALKQAINRLKGTDYDYNGENVPAYQKRVLVDGAGFEPAASTMPTWRSYQADLPAQRMFLFKLNPQH